ncbi:MAG: hypothetical protein Q9162_005838 [Coniocarpon cinnabarinum]
MRQFYRLLQPGFVKGPRLLSTRSFRHLNARGQHERVTARPSARLSWFKGKYFCSRCQQTSPSITNDDATIYALSTAPGRAAIAVIRVSGHGCKHVYSSLCKSQKWPKPRRAVVRRLSHPSNPDDILDTAALVLSFPAPSSVTGEDVLELHIHGGPAITSSVLAAIQKTSTSEVPVRYAEPGEFTRRGFYNDRLDLTQAEALGDTLSAVTEEQRRLSVQGTQGGLGEKYEEWKSMLLHARGELEALIDFSEDQHFDESSTEFTSSVAAQVRSLSKTLDIHLANAMRGELLRNGIAVSLIGSPNVGKSSILNQIVGKNAAIVSKEAGTTRDVIEVGIDLGGFFCRLGDTAGLRRALQRDEPANVLAEVVGEVEREGIRRSHAQAKQSDVVIVVFAISPGSSASAASVDLDAEVVAAANSLAAQGKTLVIAINKVDLFNPPARADNSPASAFCTGTSSAGTRDEQLRAAVRAAIPAVSDASIFLISCAAALAPRGIDSATTASTSRSSSALVHHAATDDPGNFRGFLDGVVKIFRDLTAALQPNLADEVHAGSAAAASVSASEAADNVHDTWTQNYSRSLWQESLGATARQRQLLETCRRELNRFLELVDVAGAGRPVALSPDPADRTTTSSSLASCSSSAQFLEPGPGISRRRADDPGRTTAPGPTPARDMYNERLLAPAVTEQATGAPKPHLHGDAGTTTRTTTTFQQHSDHQQRTNSADNRIAITYPGSTRCTSSRGTDPHHSAHDIPTTQQPPHITLEAEAQAAASPQPAPRARVSARAPAGPAASGATRGSGPQRASDAASAACPNLANRTDHAGCVHVRDVETRLRNNGVGVVGSVGALPRLRGGDRLAAESVADSDGSDLAERLPGGGLDGAPCARQEDSAHGARSMDLDHVDCAGAGGVGDGVGRRDHLSQATAAGSDASEWGSTSKGSCRPGEIGEQWPEGSSASVDGNEVLGGEGGACDRLDEGNGHGNGVSNDTVPSGASIDMGVRSLPTVEEQEIDIVAAAEHLRAAAIALGKITGRGESGDTENVLGVVFEKFCVGK